MKKKINEEHKIIFNYKEPTKESWLEFVKMVNEKIERFDKSHIKIQSQEHRQEILFEIDGSRLETDEEEKSREEKERAKKEKLYNQLKKELGK